MITSDYLYLKDPILDFLHSRISSENYGNKNYPGDIPHSFSINTVYYLRSSGSGFKKGDIVWRDKPENIQIRSGTKFYKKNI